MSDVLHVGSAEFEKEILKSEVPVLVEMWAPWCGPCRMIAPLLEKLAGEWKGKVRVAKVNVDENPDLAGQFGVMSIPTMFVFKGGKAVDQIIGAVPESRLRQWVEATLEK